ARIDKPAVGSLLRFRRDGRWSPSLDRPDDHASRRGQDFQLLSPRGGQPRVKREPAGGSFTRTAFSSTWATLCIPQSAVPTPGVERTNWSARCASVLRPPSTWPSSGGRFLASWPRSMDAEAVT